MNKEEKEAVEFIKFVNDLWNKCPQSSMDNTQKALLNSLHIVLNLIENQDSRIQKQNENIDCYQKEIEETRIKLLQYKNLRKEFDKLINTVLGENYYNLGMDVYSCDKIAVNDIIKKKVKFIFFKKK